MPEIDAFTQFDPEETTEVFLRRHIKELNKYACQAAIREKELQGKVATQETELKELKERMNREKVERTMIPKLVTKASAVGAAIWAALSWAKDHITW